MKDKFCNLHNHSEYSSLDGFSQIDKIAEKVKSLGQDAVAITDHGNIDGAYKFYKTCKKNEIKPILGIEAYLTKQYDENRPPYHITLLAKDINGWKNILKLFKISHLNFYYKPRISFQDLFKYKDGIICLSGCPQGIISKHIIKQEISISKENTELFKKEFGDNFYIEIMDHNIDFQKELNYNLRCIAKEYNIKTVCTNDSHYTEKEHHTFQEYLMCDNLKQTINSNKKISLQTQEFYIKHSSEINATIEEKETTIEIADKCNVLLENNDFLLLHTEEEESKLIQLIDFGLDKYKLRNNDEYIKRLREEYSVIREANLIGYFLAVQDYIKYARDNNILVGPGRGSVGGSLLAYLIGIHNVDPIQHKLLFSRFYNHGRSKSLPDIDVDFPENKIHLVREYIKNKYGKEKVAHIGTNNYLQEKSAVKLICRVLGVDFKTANEYSDIVEDEKNKAKLYEKSQAFKDIVDKSKEFIGLAVHNSIHAAGIVISPINLEEIIPLRFNKDTETYISAWDMKDIEELGLIKFDFLSLNTLDVIEDTLSKVGIKIENIPTNDSKTFNLINTGFTSGIFQLSSDGISKVATEMKVSSIDDIAVVVALYRPGPINSGLHKKYIDRKHGKEPIQYSHPLLEKILNDTYGIFVYQEQIIQATMLLANFSETDADYLRKAIGKKITELMNDQEYKFIDGCIKNGIDKELAKTIWKEIQEFAEYSFNRAHSVEYGYITYYTAYLKANYPEEFMASLLNNNFKKSDKLNLYLKECKKMGIEVTTPSVINGDYDFIVKDKKIIFGLKGINGIGEKTAKEIINCDYENFEDFCIKSRLSSDILTALTEAGALDEFNYNRNTILQSVKNISNIIKKNKKTNKKAKLLFDSKLNFGIVELKELPNEILASKEFSRLNTYIKYNPLKDIELATPEELVGEIFIEGYITDIKEHLTKNKATMAFLNLATNLGQKEAILFPKMYTYFKDSIKKNMFVAIVGFCEEEKIICKKIWKKL